MVTLVTPVPIDNLLLAEEVITPLVIIKALLTFNGDSKVSPELELFISKRRIVNAIDGNEEIRCAPGPSITTLPLDKCDMIKVAAVPFTVMSPANVQAAL